MPMIVANSSVLSSLNISTMSRSDELSASSNTYVPAGSTLPGTSTGCEKVMRVSLFHSSARVAGGSHATRTLKPKKETTLGIRIGKAPFNFYFQERRQNSPYGSE